MPHLYGIAVKLERREPMTVLPSADVSFDRGLIGDCRGSGGRDRARQVTVISLDQWSDALADLHVEAATLPWFKRRANLCVQGIRFSAQDVGKYLFIGDDTILEITGENNPCTRMEEVFPGLMAALTPDCRGGVTCRVVNGGHIREGHPVRIGFELIDHPH